MAVGVQNYTGQTVDLMAKGTTIGETITSSGNASTSAALVVLAGNSQFLNGLVVYQDSVVNDAFELRTPGGTEIAAVRKDGTEVSQRQIMGPSPLGAIMKLPVQAVSPANGKAILTFDGKAPDGINCTVLPSNTAATFNATLVAREPATGQAASFSISGGLITRGSTLAASSYVGPGSSGVAPTYMSGTSASSLGVSVGFDQATGCPVVTASSKSGHTWNWKGYVELSVEVQ